MAKVNLNINGKVFSLGCNDGEEERLTHLGGLLNERVTGLANQFGQIGDLRLMVIAAITMLDEMEDLGGDQKAQVEKLTRDITAQSEAAISEARLSEAVSYTHLTLPTILLV